MKGKRMRIVILGLSLSSSWGNGHATTYRALLAGMAERGHDILFLERNVPWYAAHRDVTAPGYCRIAFYDSVGELGRYRKEVQEADAVIVGSYVPDGVAVIQWALRTAWGITAFYDIDTPVTLASIEVGRCTYLTPGQVPQFDLYLSFTGGPLLQRLAVRYGARQPAALYCSANVDDYRPRRSRRKWDLGYLGTYSADRQPALERLLLEPARRRPELRFVVAGAQYPPTIGWPRNVEHAPHLAPSGHPAFYSSLRWALNITRADMIRAGYSPSVRLFEAAACGTPIISDPWPGLETLFADGKEIMVADTAESVVATLAMPESRRRNIGEQGRRRILREHTSRHRAAELEGLLIAALQSTAQAPLRARGKAGTERKQGTYVSPTVLT
jgi:spore maturation protein CgeB